ncbi:Pr6Pr family membrane protein [Pelagibacterium sp. H642]|uniref:Pr6Pr family membrane protein n=1 Tax=Pelagibacterium sp. H642 TaxID=1881069 RepID=UPI0028168533|nr:Pr6Pr family membrane protein [Pelagibacterium sp. H642]WMT90033.1 Pr6Pr family membrane protein [Pelagibacterium sp. H642]
MHKPLALLGLILGAAALALQLVVAVSAGGAEAAIGYVTSLLVIANLVAVLVYAGELTNAAALSAFRTKGMQGMTATAMAFAMLFYHLVAADQLHPEGLALISNVALGYVAPTLFVSYWMVYLTTGSLRLHHVAPWLLFPALFICWTLLLGTVTGIYAYDVLNVAAEGWGAVAINYLTFIAAFLMLSVFAVGFDTEKKPTPDHAPQH